MYCVLVHVFICVAICFTSAVHVNCLFQDVCIKAQVQFCWIKCLPQDCGRPGSRWTCAFWRLSQCLALGGFREPVRDWLGLTCRTRCSASRSILCRSSLVRGLPRVRWRLPLRRRPVCATFSLSIALRFVSRRRALFEHCSRWRVAFATSFHPR